MRLDGRILLLLVGALLATTSFARYVDLANHSPNYGRSNPILAARGDDDCRAKCSPKTTCCFAGAKQRRGPELYDLETSGDILPRALAPITGQAIQNYVIEMTEDAATIQVLADHSNSAVFEDLTTATGPVRVGIARLCGCTALLVVHPHGVYSAHYFEDPSFQENTDDPAAGFETTVIGFLNNGLDPYPSLRSHAITFNNADTRIYIMTPLYRGRCLYDAQITQLEDAINTILPDAPRAIRYGYNPLDGGTNNGRTQMETTALGRALFEYEPNGGNPQTRVFLQTQKFGGP